MPAQTWQPSGSIADVAERLASARAVAVVPHAKPDGDAIGATLALARTLDRLGIAATAIYAPPWPRRFDVLVGSTPVHHLDPDAPDLAPIERADLVAVLDTGTWSQLGGAAPALRGAAARTLVVDHHHHGDPELAELRCVETDAPAAAAIVARLCVRLLDFDGPARLPAEIAAPLYVGLATDTGWFRHPSVAPPVLRLAADLLEAGADHNALYRMVELNDPPERLLLMQRALGSLRFLAGGRAVLMVLRRADFEAAGATPGDTGGLVDLPRSVASVEVSALLYEPEPGRAKLSLRSKASGHPVDVNALAQSLGGGGHVHAAGVTLERPLDDALPDVVAAIETAAAEPAVP